MAALRGRFRGPRRSWATYAVKKKQDIGKLLQFDRGELNDDGFTNGYLLDYSYDWTLIQLVDQDIFIDGYLVIRNDTIERYRLFDDNGRMVHRALQKLRQFPVVPGEIDLTDVESITYSANSLFPLLVFDRELRWKDRCHIGGIAAVGPKTITISSIDTAAQYGGPYRMRSADITKIGFDGHYERALWSVASKKTRRCLTKH